MRAVILSDIHGNLSALRAVRDCVGRETGVDACLLLGDVIDYGMHSNEVIRMLQSFSIPVLCNIWGNHEKAVMEEQYSRFSSERGKLCARYTRSVLDGNSARYIADEMTPYGRCEFEVGGKRCLAIHGSLEDEYWRSISPEGDLSAYREYDYVFSGHSHIPHFFERYFESDDAVMRNRKKVTFINPGSVGQPRNHNNRAQYALFDFGTESVSLQKVCYDIKKEQSAYQGEVDEFYKERLQRGI